jgi:hypothetical protein
MKNPRELLKEVKQGEEGERIEQEPETEEAEGFDGQTLFRKGEAPIYV